MAVCYSTDDNNGAVLSPGARVYGFPDMSDMQRWFGPGGTTLVQCAPQDFAWLQCPRDWSDQQRRAYAAKFGAESPDDVVYDYVHVCCDQSVGLNLSPPVYGREDATLIDPPPPPAHDASDGGFGQ